MKKRNILILFLLLKFNYCFAQLSSSIEQSLDIMMKDSVISEIVLDNITYDSHSMLRIDLNSFFSSYQESNLTFDENFVDYIKFVCEEKRICFNIKGALLLTGNSLWIEFDSIKQNNDNIFFSFKTISNKRITSKRYYKIDILFIKQNNSWVIKDKTIDEIDWSSPYFD